MLIADSQVHLYPANAPEHPWPKREKPYTGRSSFSKDELLREMDSAGVERAVIIPASAHMKRNDLGLEAARLHPKRFAVMGHFDVKAPDARGKPATWLKQPGMLGLRFTFDIRGDATDDWLWAEAETAQVPIMMRSAGQLNFIDRAAQRHPGLKLVIDHLAMPNGKKDKDAFGHLEMLLAMAKRPNIAVKATALPAHTTDSYPYRNLHPYLRRIYDAYGPKRFFWGTDFTNLSCTYRQAVTMFTEELSWLATEDKEWIMGRGLCEWIGWKMP